MKECKGCKKDFWNVDIIDGLCKSCRDNKSKKVIKMDNKKLIQLLEEISEGIGAVNENLKEIIIRLATFDEEST